MVVGLALLVWSAALFVREEPRGGGRIMMPTAQDEEFLAFVRGIEDDAGTAIFLLDRAEWLSGADAEAAARADGFPCDEPDCLPNGFYIQNAEKDTVRYALAADAELIVIIPVENPDEPLANVPVSRTEFERLYNDPQTVKAFVPFDVTLRGGSLVRLAERYVP